MFKSGHYIPILKAKAGEFGALSELSRGVRKTITPLIDIPRVPLKYPEKKPKEPLEKYLKKVSSKISKSWGAQEPYFLDLFDIKLTERTSKGEHPLSFFFDKARTENTSLPIPVTGLDRDDGYNNAVKHAISQDNRGACLRILKDDIELPFLLEDNINDLLNKLAISKTKAHLLIDLGSIFNENTDWLLQTIVEALGSMNKLEDWQSLTIAGSSFPETLSSIRPDFVGSIPRREFDLWRKIVAQSAGGERSPSFGDYGIAYPIVKEMDPTKMTLGAKIRYTADDSWLVVKGRSFKTHPDGYKQYHALSKKLVGHAHYKGPGFSWGDDYVSKCANNRTKSGNLATWVKVDTNHHLTFVANQIASIGAP